MNYFELMADYIGSGAVRLPVVELSTTLSRNVALTAEESAKLTEIYDAGSPAVIKCNINLGTLVFDNCAIVFSVGEMKGDISAPAFYASLGSTVFALIRLADTWRFSADS